MIKRNIEDVELILPIVKQYSDTKKGSGKALIRHNY